MFFPTVFGQIWPKKSQKFAQIGDFRRIVESVEILSYLDFVSMFYEPASIDLLFIAWLVQLSSAFTYNFCAY
jgi:hypothetical protein